MRSKQDTTDLQLREETETTKTGTGDGAMEATNHRLNEEEEGLTARANKGSERGLFDFDGFFGTLFLYPHYSTILYRVEIYFI